jgi:thermostable 8-oxoguanine DNA glycosylase
MTAPATIPTDLAVLDQHIVRALVALRLARAASARADNRKNVEAEARAEANMNALLEFRHATRRRSAS